MCVLLVSFSGHHAQSINFVVQDESMDMQQLCQGKTKISPDITIVTKAKLAAGGRITSKAKQKQFNPSNPTGARCCPGLL